MLRRCLLALLPLLIALPLAADGPAARVQMIGAEGEGLKYWPCWRGPTMQGVVPDGPYVDRWSDKDNVLWKVELPGKGNSSPIIWADRIYLTTSYDNGAKRSILCLNRKDGSKRWEAFAPAAAPEKVKDKNGWASGTPTTDGERIYAYFGNAGVVCVDSEGKQVWHQAFPPMDAYHGMACSPLLYKDRVIIFQDHKTKFGSFVVAFDKKSGKELWKTARKEKVGWGSPVAIRVDGQDQILVSSEYRTYAYDPADGKELWSCGGNLVEVIPAPVVGHDLIFCCSGRAGPTLAIDPVKAVGDVTAKAIVWKSLKGSPFVPSPLVYGDYLYTINDMISVVQCFEAKSGKLMWQERLGQAKKEGMSTSPLGVNGKVFVTNDDGETYVLKAGPKYELLGVNRLNDKTLASPALLDGLWYWRTDRQLLCIGKS